MCTRYGSGPRHCGRLGASWQWREQRREPRLTVLLDADATLLAVEPLAGDAAAGFIARADGAAAAAPLLRRPHGRPRRGRPPRAAPLHAVRPPRGRAPRGPPAPSCP